MKYSGGWSFSEAYNLPIGLREWFVKRLVKQLKDESDAMQQASKGGSGQGFTELSAHNAPQAPPQFQSLSKRQG